MKKMISVLFTSLLILLSVWGVDIFKDVTLNNILYKNTTSIVVTFPESKPHTQHFIEYLQKLAEEEQVSISKYIYRSENDLIVYTTDVSLNHHIDLKNGAFPTIHSGKFISTFNTNDDKQSGVIKQFDLKKELTIKHLDEDTNFSAEGIYYVSTQEKEKLDAIVAKINQDAANAEIYSINNSFEWPIQMDLVLCIVLVLCCLFVAVIHNLINHLKKLTMMRVFGYSTRSIVLHFAANLAKNLFVSSVIAYFLFSLYFITVNGWDYFLFFSFSFIMIAFVLMLVLIFPVLISTAFLFSKRVNTARMKGKKPYLFIHCMNAGLKLLFISFLLFSVHQWMQTMGALNQKLENYSTWEKAKNIYTTTVTYNGENDLKVQYETSKKIKKFFQNMEEAHQAFLIDAANYEKIGETFTYELNDTNGNENLSPNGKSVTINMNYLNDNPIKATEGSIKEQIILDDHVMNILVPEKLKQYEKEIEKQFLSNFYFQKVEVENIYNETLEKKLNDTKEKELSIHIIYVKDQQTYFTYDASIAEDNKNLIEDPIAIVDTGNIDPSYYLSYVSSGNFYFYSDQLDAYSTIISTIKESDALSSVQQVTAIYDEQAKKVQQLSDEKYKLQILIVILMIANLTITYHTIASYYERCKFKIYIKKLHGYSDIRRNQSHILLILSINVIPIMVMNYYFDTSMILVGVPILLLELLVGVIFNKRLSNQSLNSIIKGEQ